MPREWVRRYREFWGDVLGPIGRPALWHIGFIMLAIPLQLLLSHHLARTVDLKTTAEDRFANRLFTDHFTTWLSLELWRALYLFKLRHGIVEVSPSLLYPDTRDPQGECPAVEVMRMRFPQGHYAMSPVPRQERTGVEFRIGNVVQHRVKGYRGVVIGWDLRARAPQEWFRANYEPNQVLAAHIKAEPHFAILVDIRDRSPPQMVYVPQHKLIHYRVALGSERGSFDHVINPAMLEYFADFNGFTYVPRPWLKALYPKD